MVKRTTMRRLLAPLCSWLGLVEAVRLVEEDMNKTRGGGAGNPFESVESHKGNTPDQVLKKLDQLDGGITFYMKKISPTAISKPCVEAKAKEPPPAAAAPAGQGAPPAAPAGKGGLSSMLELFGDGDGDSDPSDDDDDSMSEVHDESDGDRVSKQKKDGKGRKRAKKSHHKAHNSHCQCPVSGHGKNTETEKYDKRATDNQCDDGRGMWSEDSSPIIKFKYETIGKVFGLNKSFRVLDWGSGCGHQLDVIAGQMSFHAVGMDLVKANTNWAKKHLKHLDNFCTIDGSGGLPFAEGSFDVVLSNGALHHIQGLENQCKVLKQEIVHVLSPGGCAWFGYSHAKAAPLAEAKDLKACVMKGAQNIVFVTINEQELFGTSEYGDSRAYSMFLCRKG